ncbi:MAG: TetR/AcrR family transcriptional regulator [Gemmatimonadaceae bacterium]|nr:TetR/AcrR family transcriptional regulator [Gemmatimonadaceae bacterium]
MSDTPTLSSPRPPRQERGRRRMDEILDAAEQLLLEVGPANGSVQEIARRAGSSVGSIYHFFPTKDAIVAALRARHEEEGKQVRVAIREAVETGADLPLAEFVDRLISPLADFVERRPAAFMLGALDAPDEKELAHKDAPLEEALRAALRHRDPHCSEDELDRRLTVFGTIGRSVADLIMRGGPQHRHAFVEEMKRAMYGYLLTYEMP